MFATPFAPIVAVAVALAPSATNIFVMPELIVPVAPLMDITLIMSPSENVEPGTVKFTFALEYTM